MSIIDDVKKLLNGTLDEKLEIVERRTKERLSSLVNLDNVPDQLDYISYEVTLKRFNRIGQEGMTSYTQEGLSMVFPDSDFSEYQQEIDDFIKNNDPNYSNRTSAARFF